MLFYSDGSTMGFDVVVSCAEVLRVVAMLGGASRLYTSSISFVLAMGLLSAPSPSDLFAIFVRHIVSWPGWHAASVVDFFTLRSVLVYIGR